VIYVMTTMILIVVGGGRKESECVKCGAHNPRAAILFLPLKVALVYKTGAREV